MASRDYSGRTVDLAVLQGVQPVGEQALTLGLGGETGGLLVTGAQKAAQLFVLLLLTEQGRRPHDRAFGTQFLRMVRETNMTDALLQTTFSAAADTILEQQNGYLPSDAAADERLTSIELLSFASPQPDMLSIEVQLTTAAGTARRVIVPISLSVR